MFLAEAVSFSIQSLRAIPVRSLLTGLGMVIGTASVILVARYSVATSRIPPASSLRRRRAQPLADTTFRAYT